MQIRAVVFDLEGTLFSSKQLSKEHMSLVLDLISTRLNTIKEVALKLLILKREEMLTKLGYAPPLTSVAQTFGISKLDFFETISRVDPTPYVKPDAELRTMFRTLKGLGLKLVLLTNVSCEYTAKILEALDLNRDAFDCVMTGSDMKKVKPDPSSFLSVLKSLDLPSRQVLMVGDRVAIDLAPAKKLGMKTALVTRKDVSLCTKNKIVDVILPRVYDLITIVETCAN